MKTATRSLIRTILTVGGFAAFLVVARQAATPSAKTDPFAANLLDAIIQAPAISTIRTFGGPDPLVALPAFEVGGSRASDRLKAPSPIPHVQSIHTRLALAY